jgi:hypothetical protein
MQSGAADRITTVHCKAGAFEAASMICVQRAGLLFDFLGGEAHTRRYTMQAENTGILHWLKLKGYCIA